MSRCAHWSLYASGTFASTISFCVAIIGFDDPSISIDDFVKEPQMSLGLQMGRQ
ncbi:hypothetical protein Hanom_Chr12g01096581 [Helianthus anomalus]